MTRAVLPSTRTWAPMRSSSATCMYRFSKIDSVMVLTPAAWVMSTMYWACMSVGKPGWGRVVTLAACSVRGERTRRLSGPSSIRRPVSRSFSITASRCGGWQSRTSISPPAIAQAAR